MAEMTHREWVFSLSDTELIAEGYCVKCRDTETDADGPCGDCCECSLCCTCGTFDEEDE